MFDLWLRLMMLVWCQALLSFLPCGVYQARPGPGQTASLCKTFRCTPPLLIFTRTTKCNLTLSDYSCPHGAHRASHIAQWCISTSLWLKMAPPTWRVALRTVRQWSVMLPMVTDGSANNNHLKVMLSSNGQHLKFYFSSCLRNLLVRSESVCA